MLTHIHLDHAAATGALVRRWPDLEVYVHERGARHLIDPSKLLASAERLYGDQMEYLWGEIVPVPEANVKPLAGGEDVLGMRVAYTPGHASHHVCYLHEESGTAFVGDVAAVRIPGVDLVVPPTPPPDIDVETWLESIDLVESWRPERLAVTHFGAIEEPIEHLELVRRRLREEADLARDLTEDEYERRHRERVHRQRQYLRGRRGADPVRPTAVPVARPQPLLGKARRARSGQNLTLGRFHNGEEKPFGSLFHNRSFNAIDDLRILPFAR